MSANRITFLLHLLAGIFAVQLAIYTAGAVSCIYVGLRTQKAVCKEYDENLQRATESAITTVLALLGGKVMEQ